MIESLILMWTFGGSHFPPRFYDLLCVSVSDCITHCISLYHVIKPCPQCRGCGDDQNQKHMDFYVFYETDHVDPLMQSQHKWNKGAFKNSLGLMMMCKIVSSWSALQVSVHISWYLSNPTFGLRPSLERQTVTDSFSDSTRCMIAW